MISVGETVLVIEIEKNQRDESVSRLFHWK